MLGNDSVEFDDCHRVVFEIPNYVTTPFSNLVFNYNCEEDIKFTIYDIDDAINCSDNQYYFRVKFNDVQMYTLELNELTAKVISGKTITIKYENFIQFLNSNFTGNFPDELCLEVEIFTQFNLNLKSYKKCFDLIGNGDIYNLVSYVTDRYNIATYETCGDPYFSAFKACCDENTVEVRVIDKFTNIIKDEFSQEWNFTTGLDLSYNGAVGPFTQTFNIGSSYSEVRKASRQSISSNSLEVRRSVTLNGIIDSCECLKLRPIFREYKSVDFIATGCVGNFDDIEISSSEIRILEYFGMSLGEYKIPKVCDPPMINLESSYTEHNRSTCSGSIISEIPDDYIGELIYNWFDDSNALISVDVNLYDVPTGQYYLTISDECCNEYYYEYFLSNFEIELDVKQPCGDERGMIIIETVEGVSGTYSTEWYKDGVLYASNNTRLAVYETGEYCALITDEMGCLGQECVSIFSNEDLIEEVTVSYVTECNETDPTLSSNDGSIDITFNIPDDTTLDELRWNGPNGYFSSSEDISNLTEGIYNLFIKFVNDEGYACVVTKEIDIKCCTECEFIESEEYNGGDWDCFTNTYLPEISAEVTNTSSATSNNGSIELTISEQVYSSLEWTSTNGFVSNNEDISGLEPGDYRLEIIGPCGEEHFSYYIIFDESACPDFTIEGEVTCASNNQPGGVDLAVIGLEGYREYLWSNGSNVQDLITNVSGTYTVTVTHENNCSATASFVVPGADRLSFDIGIYNMSNCDEEMNIVATIEDLSGVVSPYEVQWSNGETANSTTLPTNFVGNYERYTVTISDACNREVTGGGEYTCADVGDCNKDCIKIKKTGKPWCTEYCDDLPLGCDKVEISCDCDDNVLRTVFVKTLNDGENTTVQFRGKEKISGEDKYEMSATDVGIWQFVVTNESTGCEQDLWFEFPKECFQPLEIFTENFGGGGGNPDAPDLFCEEGYEPKRCQTKCDGEGNEDRKLYTYCGESICGGDILDVKSLGLFDFSSVEICECEATVFDCPEELEIKQCVVKCENNDTNVEAVLFNYTGTDPCSGGEVNWREATNLETIFVMSCPCEIIPVECGPGFDSGQDDPQGLQSCEDNLDLSNIPQTNSFLYLEKDRANNLIIPHIVSDSTFGIEYTYGPIVVDGVDIKLVRVDANGLVYIVGTNESDESVFIKLDDYGLIDWQIILPDFEVETINIPPVRTYKKIHLYGYNLVTNERMAYSYDLTTDESVWRILEEPNGRNFGLSEWYTNQIHYEVFVPGGLDYNIVKYYVGSTLIETIIPGEVIIKDVIPSAGNGFTIAGSFNGEIEYDNIRYNTHGYYNIIFFIFDATGQLISVKYIDTQSSEIVKYVQNDGGQNFVYSGYSTELNQIDSLFILNDQLMDDNFDFCSFVNGFQIPELDFFDNNNDDSEVSLNSFENTTLKVDLSPKVYPNPFSNSFNLEFNASQNEEVEVKVFDVNGQIHIANNIQMHKGINDILIDGSDHLTPGVYIISIKNNSLDFNFKIVKIE